MAVMLQVVGTFLDGPLPFWAIAMYQVVTLLSYTNSAVNPVLYAFLTDNFRRTLAESFQRSSRTATSSVVARGLALCSNALYVTVQQPILLTPPVLRKRRTNTAVASQSLAGPSEPHVDKEELREDSGDADVVQTSSRSLPTSLWIQSGKQSPSIELHAVYEDSASDQSP